ncbi:abhydrolase domain-containing 18 [Psychrobacter sp. FDAARGOS_221]|nr:abhydrolase domain-containing 18 [Psychrobacter sp. FDAARGOS_221]
MSLEQLHHWQLPNSMFVPIKDANIHVVMSGKCITNTDDAYKSTETIVLLHGTSASLHTWDGWTKALESEYCVLRLDMPGFGLTGPYTDENKRYTLDNYVDTVIKVMDALGIGKVSIAGNSLGGGVAWLMALKYPNRVNKLILVDASGLKFKSKSVPIGFKLAQYRMLDSLITKVLPKRLIRDSVQSVYADTSKVTEALVNRYYELALRTGNRKALIQRMREGLSTRQVGQLSDITQPTLIIWGRQDKLIPIDSAYRFEQAIPNSQLAIFDNLGHVPQEEDPEATVAVVKQFLQSSALND